MTARDATELPSVIITVRIYGIWFSATRPCHSKCTRSANVLAQEMERDTPERPIYNSNYDARTNTFTSLPSDRDDGGTLYSRSNCSKPFSTTNDISPTFPTPSPPHPRVSATAGASGASSSDYFISAIFQALQHLTTTTFSKRLIPRRSFRVGT
ncbi:hypothetical protein CC86DRAFT_93123 [Ophiobolus disseminans]|uniref:Uncharacterized protein n=1 Tax=Ophiobolus disseminans TaxID=1469910 RepID=A0A6A7AJ42_9PLEO|nr:hypothetical protein CC86DRAFT_93123 [Ophiobolus disseminans]